MHCRTSDGSRDHAGMRTLAALALIVMLGVVGPLAPADAADYNTHLTRAPYLTDLVGLHVIVNFATDQTGTTASVSYGPFDGTTCTLPSSQSATRSTVTVGSLTHYQWKASLTLPSAGQYCYRVLLGGTDLLGTGNSPVFTTQASAGSTQPFSFAVFGDWGLVDANGNNPDQQNLLGTLAGSGVRFAVTTGDNGYPSGSQTNYGDLKQVGAAMGAIFGARFWPVPGASVPHLHGIRQPWPQWHRARRPEELAAGSSPSRARAAATRTTSTAASTARRPPTTRAPGTPSMPGPRGSTCSRRPGATPTRARRASMPMTTRRTSRPGRPSIQWLLADLQAHPSGLKFAFSHYPFYSTTRARAPTRSCRARARSRGCSRRTA